MTRWARRRAGMSQQELARAVGMPQPSIARIESGAVVPRTATLITILEATGHVLTVEPSGPTVDRAAIRRRLARSVAVRTWNALGRATMRRRTNPVFILRRLGFYGVPHVLIGELAEVAHGSGVKVGRGIELVHARTEKARTQLAMALRELEATTSDRVRFKTAAGRLRLLTETPAGDDYTILAPNAVWMYVDSGIRVRVAALDDLIRIRRALGTPEDRAAEAMLRAIGEELR